jgi:hypothetical protein
MDQAIDSMNMMVCHEPSYKCRDYLDRRKQRCEPDSHSTVLPSSDDCIDVICREKMCEWSYRVCEHFSTSREIVAIAFSYLDRFVDRCSCDRTAFKLAAMTTLYMATKIFNSKQIAICSLVELSRGEFEMRHIAEMEKIILETLAWRVNPPTSQAYISELVTLLSLKDEATEQYIYNCAMFFAELSVYDYSFVVEDRLLIGLAALLNAIDSSEPDVAVQKSKEIMMTKLKDSLEVRFDDETIEHAQRRLWYLYSCSAEMDEQEANPPQALQWRTAPVTVNKRSEAGSHSPISVDMKGRL